MQRSTALKKLNALFGKSAGYRIDDRAPTPEQRSAAKAELQTAIAERDRVRAAKTTRYEAVLKADQEYQALAAASKEAGRRVDSLSGVTRHYKITVGKSSFNGLFFSVMAEADSWEEIFEKLAQKQEA